VLLWLVMVAGFSLGGVWVYRSTMVMSFFAICVGALCVLAFVGLYRYIELGMVKSYFYLVSKFLLRVYSLIVFTCERVQHEYPRYATSFRPLRRVKYSYLVRGAISYCRKVLDFGRYVFITSGFWYKHKLVFYIDECAIRQLHASGVMNRAKFSFGRATVVRVIVSIHWLRLLYYKALLWFDIYAFGRSGLPGLSRVKFSFGRAMTRAVENTDDVMITGSGIRNEPIWHGSPWQFVRLNTPQKTGRAKCRVGTLENRRPSGRNCHEVFTINDAYDAPPTYAEVFGQQKEKSRWKRFLGILRPRK